MCQELRKLMASADYDGPLGDDGKHVEIDETVMGGYQSNRVRRAKGSNKSLVFAMVERDGKLRAGPILNLSQDTLESIVRGHVKEGTKIRGETMSVLPMSVLRNLAIGCRRPRSSLRSPGAADVTSAGAIVRPQPD